MKPIFLIGYMGSGKSTMGRSLSRHLNIPLIDLDIFIESRFHRTVKEIFAENQELVGTFINLWTIERKVDGGKFLKVVAEFETRIDKYA